MARLLLVVLLAAGLQSGSMTLPRYKGTEQLIRPEGYRRWMFVGANYGMGYTELKPGQAAAPPGTFHNIFIQPDAYDHYVKTGSFPDKTMLVMEVFKPGTNASINKRGMFQDEFLGIEVALKDGTKFPEKWAYFSFFEGSKQLSEARPFPKERCWSCHNQHGAADNVFTQFYPALRNRK